MLKVHTLNDQARAHSNNAGHATEVPPHARWLYCNGQVGARLDGTIPDSSKEQIHVIFGRIGAILNAANMSFHDVVKFSIYVTNDTIIADYLEVCGEYMGDHNPPATLLVVNPFPRAGIEVEIEAVAAKVDA